MEKDKRIREVYDVKKNTPADWMLSLYFALEKCVIRKQKKDIFYKYREVESIYTLIRMLEITRQGKRFLKDFIENEEKKHWEKQDLDFGIAFNLNVDNALEYRKRFVKKWFVQLL